MSCYPVFYKVIKRDSESFTYIWIGHFCNVSGFPFREISYYVDIEGMQIADYFLNKEKIQNLFTGTCTSV